MITIYFSGTGNSKYIAESFSNKMKSKAYSIEENINFKELILNNKIIVFCYPIYGSMVPLIMRKFVEKYRLDLNGKKIIIFCTQYLFSGDGSRVFTELLEGIECEIIYSDHFNMPNNICNINILPIADARKIEKYKDKAERKISRACKNIENGKKYKKGFNTFSEALGYYSQRIYFKKVETRANKDVRINRDCILCLKCIKICPTNNLVKIKNIIEQKGNCTLCYRCVNQCPKKAITVLKHSKVKKQYRGFEIK